MPESATSFISEALRWAVHVNRNKSDLGTRDRVRRCAQQRWPIPGSEQHSRYREGDHNGEGSSWRLDTCERDILPSEDTPSGCWKRVQGILGRKRIRLAHSVNREADDRPRKAGQYI